MPPLRVVSPIQQRDPHAWLAGCDYGRIQSLMELDDFLACANKQMGVGTDLETTTLDTWTPDPNLRIVAYNFAIGPGRARFVPVGHNVGYEKNLPPEKVQERLEQLDREGYPTLWYGGVYDHEVLHVCANGWYPKLAEEVLFAVWFTDCHQKSFGLKAAADRLLGLVMPSFKEVTEGRNFADVDPDEALVYGCADGDMTGRLWWHPKVNAAVRRQFQAYMLERTLIPAFRETLRNGQYWDDEVLRLIEEELGAEVKGKGKVLKEASGIIGQVTDEIIALLGARINFDAPEQVGNALLSAGVPIIERTKGSEKKAPQVATGKEILEKYACKHEEGKPCPVGPVIDAKGNPLRNAQGQPAIMRKCHPVVSKMIKRRELTAYARNYVSKIRKGIAKYGPHLHFPFRQIGAPTGRMSAGGDKQKGVEKGMIDINEQSMPDSKKKKYLPDIRAGLIANDPRLNIAPDDPEGFDIVSIDFSQLQLRIAANVSREPAWVNAFNSGVDIHLANARLAYNEPNMPRYIPDPSRPGEETENPKRGKGKTMSFAVLFGAEDETVAEHGNITVEEAKTLLASFWGGAPVLTSWIHSTHARARTEKVVRTILGRERPLHEWYTEAGLRPLGPRQRKTRDHWLAEKGDREAVNSIIQGNEAEIFKIACVKVYAAILAHDWRDHCKMNHFMHDELVFRVRRRLKDVIVPELMRIMGGIKIAGWPVDITVEAETGPNWGKGLKGYTVPEVPCPTCQTPMSMLATVCTACKAVETQFGTITGVHRRQPLAHLPQTEVDPRIQPRLQIGRRA